MNRPIDAIAKVCILMTEEISQDYALGKSFRVILKIISKERKSDFVYCYGAFGFVINI